MEREPESFKRGWNQRGFQVPSKPPWNSVAFTECEKEKKIINAKFWCTQHTPSFQHCKVNGYIYLYILYLIMPKDELSVSIRNQSSPLCLHRDSRNNSSRRIGRFIEFWGVQW